MATAVQFLTSASPSTKTRIYDVYGSDSALRTDVLTEIERRVFGSGSVNRISLAFGELSDDSIWQRVFTTPLGTTSRLIILSSPERMKSVRGLQRFISDKASCSDTVLVLLSERAEAGTQVRDPNQKLPGKPVWKTVLSEWEQCVRDYASGTYISCNTPSSELPPTGDRGGVGALSSLAKWMSLRVEVTQQQADYLWARTGQRSLLSRDVLDQFQLCGVRSARLMGVSEFRRVVDSLITSHGSEDFAELVLFGHTQRALTSLAEHDFSSAEWARTLGYLSQRLDWLAPLHDALATKERLDQVQRRLGIHRKWILWYAHREDSTHNIARHYDGVRVARCRRLLAELDASLTALPGVPPAFGEALLASW